MGWDRASRGGDRNERVQVRIGWGETVLREVSRPHPLGWERWESSQWCQAGPNARSQHGSAKGGEDLGTLQTEGAFSWAQRACSPRWSGGDPPQSQTLRVRGAFQPLPWPGTWRARWGRSGCVGPGARIRGGETDRAPRMSGQPRERPWRAMEQGSRWLW